MDTLRKSRNPTVMFTDNDEVHTNEEAQVFVHDINLFVTVQLIGETFAVSLKLCSYERVSAQKKTRFTKRGERIVCKTDNFVRLVVPRMLINSGSNTSWASTSKDWSSSPGQERSDEVAPRKWCEWTPKRLSRKRGMTVEIRSTVCEIFQTGKRSSQVIWKTWRCVLAHISHDSDSERSTKKWYQNQGSTVFFFLPRRPKLRSLHANQK